MNFVEWLESLTYAQCCALASQSGIQSWLSIHPDKLRGRLEENEAAKAVFEEIEYEPV